MTTTVPMTEQEVTLELDSLSMEELQELHAKIEDITNQANEAFETSQREEEAITIEADSKLNEYDKQLDSLELQAQKDIEALAQEQAMHSLNNTTPGE